jgi:hypothetical protein
VARRPFCCSVFLPRRPSVAGGGVNNALDCGRKRTYLLAAAGNGGRTTAARPEAIVCRAAEIGKPTAPCTWLPAPGLRPVQTRAYRDRRAREQLSPKDILRCLKRYLAREVYKALTRKTPPIPNFQRQLDSHRSIGAVHVGLAGHRWPPEYISSITLPDNYRQFFATRARTSASGLARLVRFAKYSATPYQRM